MHRLNKSDFGLFKDKFVNARVLLGLFMRNRLRCLLRLLNIIVRHVQENFFSLLKFVNLFKFFLISDTYKRSNETGGVNVGSYFN